MQIIALIVINLSMGGSCEWEAQSTQILGGLSSPGLAYISMYICHSHPHHEEDQVTRRNIK